VFFHHACPTTGQNGGRAHLWLAVASVLAFASVGAGAAAAEGDAIESNIGGVIVTSDACARIELHEPAPDVAYEPGVDVHGDPVVPPNVDDEALRIEEDEIAIDPNIPSSSFFTLPDGVARILDEPEVRLGLVTIRDGRPYLGDRPLRSQEENALAAACAELQAEERADDDEASDSGE